MIISQINGGYATGRPCREIPGNFQSPGIGKRTSGLVNCTQGKTSLAVPGWMVCSGGRQLPAQGAGTLVQIPGIWQNQRYPSKKAVPILPRTQPSQNNRIPTSRYPHGVPRAYWLSAKFPGRPIQFRQLSSLQTNGYPPEKLPDHGDGTSRMTGYPGRIGPEQKIRQ